MKYDKLERIGADLAYLCAVTVESAELCLLKGLTIGGIISTRLDLPGLNQLSSTVIFVQSAHALHLIYIDFQYIEKPFCATVSAYELWACP